MNILKFWILIKGAHQTRKKAKVDNKKFTKRKISAELQDGNGRIFFPLIPLIVVINICIFLFYK
jgi:hypothetical protein